MKPKFTLACMLVFGTAIVIFVGCKEKTHDSNTNIVLNEDLKSEISAAADKHYKTWFPKIIDSINGGFYTNFEYDWSRSEQQEKMLVTQARDLWAASFAAQQYPNDSTYKIAADHGYEFLTTKMWDAQYGGFLLNYSEDQHQQVITYKLLYANAFALFGLSEYAKINPSKTVLKWIERTFQWMDFKARRQGETGYYNIIPDSLIDKSSPAYKDFARAVGWGKPDWKDQNTSIHILEAFTNAFLVWQDPRLKMRLEEMLFVVRDKMVNDKNSLNLYFDKDFKPITFVDSSRESIIKNINLDHVSFGHNIETAFLLVDASKALYGTIDSNSMRVATALLEHTIDHGFAPGYNGIYDKAYQFKGTDSLEIMVDQKVWWAQAEALHTLILFADLIPDKRSAYMDIAQKQWDYMKANILDETYGGWYGKGLDINPESKMERKANQWKGPYHDGRALSLCKMYLSK